MDVIRSALDANTTLERRHAGGSCGNVLAILSYLGMCTTVVGRIGDDPAGSELLADLQRCEVDVKLLAVEQGRRTPIVIQDSFIDSRGRPRHRFFRACPACGATMPGYRPLLTADAGKITSKIPPHCCFFFDRVAPGPLELARHSRKQGALVVFEPSGIKDEKLFIDCLRTSHVLKYSHERLSGLDSVVRQARPPLEIETRGGDGLLFRRRKAGRLSRWMELEAIPAPSLRDSAGSGDWCTAGFLANLTTHLTAGPSALEDLEMVRHALRFGQALAALNCAYDGARGLMYAIPKTQVATVVGRLLANETPRLADRPSPSLVESRSDRACLVCASGLSGARE